MIDCKLQNSGGDWVFAVYNAIGEIFERRNDMKFNKPYFGNILGRILTLFYGAVYSKPWVYYKISDIPARLYYAKRIWPTKNIIGQTFGEYIFINNKIKDTTLEIPTANHEFIHTNQLLMVALVSKYLLPIEQHQ
jgi:hypothetical protein